MKYVRRKILLCIVGLAIILFFNVTLFELAKSQTAFMVGTDVENITPCPTSPGGCQIDYIHLIANNISTTGGNASPVTSIESPLTARALVLQDAQGHRVAMVTLDLLGVNSAFISDVRVKIQQLNIGFASKDILINVSHTHNGPTMIDLTLGINNVYGLSNYEVSPDQQYLDSVKARIVKAIQVAVNNLHLASLYFGSGQSSIAAWRRATDSKRPTQQAFSQRLDILQAKDTNNMTLAVAFFFGCHATSMYGATGQISSDYPGKARAYIESQMLASGSAQAKAFFFQGFGGDLEPYLLEVPGSLLRKDAKDQTGTDLGSSIMNVINSPMNLLSGNLQSSSNTVNLPLSTEDPGWNNNGSSSLPTEIQTIQIGSDQTSQSFWALVASANEVVSEYAVNVRSKWLNPSHVTLAGYSNGVASYIPTRRMILHDHDPSIICGILPNAYEGCFSFHLYYLRLPNWMDSSYFSNDSPMSDNFDDNVRDPDKWYTSVLSTYNNQSLFDANVTVSEQNQNLKITPLAQSGLHYNGYVSISTYNFSGRQASVQVVQTPNPATTAEMVFSIGVDGNNLYRFDIQSGQLRADERFLGNSTYFQLGSYDPTQQKYLRIRHDQTNNLIIWEASGDNIIWSTLHSRSPQLDLANIRIELIAGTYASVNSPGTAIWDNFQIKFSDPTNSLSDNFDDNSRNTTKWNINVLSKYNNQSLFDANVTVQEQNQRLEVTPRTQTYGLHYNGYVSVGTYNFSGRQASVQVFQTPNISTTAEMTFSVGADGDNLYRFDIQTGLLRADERISGNSTYFQLGSYNSSQQKYLRIRHDQTNNLIIWETSGDNLIWNVVHSRSPQFDLSNVRVELIAGTYTSVNSPGTAIWDNFVFESIGSQSKTMFLPIVETERNAIRDYLLQQNYPNPFNPSTMLKYQLPTDSRVRVTIYNVLGQVVATLIDENQQAGYQQAEWNASNATSGMYFYKLEASSIIDPAKVFQQVRKMVLLK